jgi:hypothetical protein
VLKHDCWVPLERRQVMWLIMCILPKHASMILTQITIVGTIIIIIFDVDPKYANSNYDQTIIFRCLERLNTHY